MDTKKLILTIVLSVAVLLAWQYFFMPKPAPVSPIASPAETTQTQDALPQPSAAPETGTADIGSILGGGEPAVEEKDAVLPAVPEDLSAPVEQPVTVEGPLFTAHFTNRGAGLVSLVLKNYKDDAGQPMNLVSSSAEASGFYPFYFLNNTKTLDALNKAMFRYQGQTTVEVAHGRETEIVFEYADAAENLLAVKKFIFNPTNYVIGLKFEVIKDGRLVADLPVVFGPDLGNNDSLTVP